MAVAPEVGKFLRLTKSKILLKSAEKTYTLWSIFENKRLILDDDDMEIIRRSIIDGYSEIGYGEKMADAVLKRYIIKFCADKNYYTIADRNNFMFIMGLKKETFEKITYYHHNI